ncbi:hypothetical protein GEV29_12690 [Aeromicrobium sp. SMF47]|uniref:Uncharacterized protein n=1 Tax=Aeromicrobium yanjiei TaxID=2662028 RepID=A0A5Q2MK99_9ACTN|nr:hypothetical protein [Aeromicrobium yanjiei]MRJ77397.1 hypothetical protein [Aeromicrobium yanjiei]QGG41486.1 hypothetical protein GEV26_08990 [Aeromicrobium yanjiei]
MVGPSFGVASMSSEYVLVSHWSVARSREDLWDVLDEWLATDDPMVWWPSVHTESYDGSRLRLRARSVLGYALRFSLDDLVRQRPETLSFTSDGDLRGRGIVTFVELGPSSSRMDIDWRVAVDRRWMRLTGWFLRPAFVAGHHLIMRQGERNLRRWLEAQRV